MKKIIYLFFAAAFLAGCSDDKTDSPGFSPEIMTLQARDIFYDRVTFQGQYNGRSEDVASYGFAVSDAPLKGGGEDLEYTCEGPVSGVFRYKMDGMERNTDYYVRAFVTKSSGQKLYGDLIVCRTSDVVVDLPSEPTSVVEVVDSWNIIVTETVSSLGDEKMTASDKKIAVVKPADFGIYFWTEEQGRANASKYSLGEDFASVMNIADDVILKIDGFKPGTTYSYCPFVQAYTSYYTDTWKAYTSEVEGAEGTFTMPGISSPEVQTSGYSEVTPTSAIISGILTFGGGDPDVRFGVEYGTSEGDFGNKVYAAGFEDEDTRSFSVFVKGLSAGTTYYFRAFAENELATVPGQASSFTTDVPGNPVVSEYLVDYETRAARFTPTSVVLRAKLLSDGGSPLTGKGFKWGLSRESLENTANVDGEILSDGVYNYFELELTSIPEGIVYYKPFASNSQGNSELDQVLQVRTAVSGGNSYTFDPAKNLIPTYANMVVAEGTELTYFELDPIVVTSGNPAVTKAYYLLDRNLGATVAYGADFYDKSFADAANYPKLFDAAGYYYQWDRAIPSATPDMNVTSNINGSPYNWSNKEGYFTNPPMNLTTEWGSKVCPEGYDLPTMAQITEMVAAVEPAAINQTMPRLFKAMRFGTTGMRNGTNGNLTTAPGGSQIWLKDGPDTSPGSLTGTQIPSMVIGEAPAGAFSTPYSGQRYVGRPVRCVRVVIIE